MPLLSRPSRTDFWTLFLGLTAIQGFVSTTQTISQAQTVSPDGSLGSIVSADADSSAFRITGGSSQGSNLFHSFETFSPQDWSASFDLTNETFGSNIERILTRVTGNQASEINAPLEILGGNRPDLFLLNPHGILFGPNAQLNLPGSFVATTAESLQFSDGSSFSALLPQASASLLSISAPVGLQMGQNPGEIAVVGNGHNIQRSSSFAAPLQDPAFEAQGLSISPGNTLALIGGPIRFDGGEVQPVYEPTPNAQRLPLGGISLSLAAISQGTVNLQANELGWGVSLEEIGSYEDIALTHQSWLNGTGLAPSNVNITGRNITIEDGSSISLGNLSEQATGGDINITASGKIKLVGAEQLISSIQNTAFNDGDGGNVNLLSNRLTLTDGAIVASSTDAAGNGGAVTLNVAEDLRIDGFTDPLTPSPLFTEISGSTFGRGNAGIVDVTARTIELERGGRILSGSFGPGQGGDLTVTGTDSITLRGINPLSLATTAITAASFRSGDSADQVQVKTQNLEILEGATLGSDAFGSGDAGTVIVEASDSIRILGGSLDPALAPSEITSAVGQRDLGATAFSAGAGAVTGNSGDVTIRTPSLEVGDQGRVDVTNLGRGNTGSLKIQAQQINLANQSRLTVSQRNGEGGLLDLQASESILLRNNSLISVNPRGRGGTGSAGNISIQTPFLIAVPDENSDITASVRNSFGTGGEIRIDASSVLGLEVQQEQRTDQSEIAAFARQGEQSNGDVTVTQPEKSPASQLQALPSSFAAQETELASNSCSSNAEQFTQRGRGGLPLGPQNLLHDTLHPPEPSDPINQAIALRNQGFYPKALSLLQAEVAALTQAPEPDLERQIIVLRQLGITQQLLAQHQESQASLDQSLALALKLESQALREAHISATRLILGNLARAKNDNKTARWQYQQALTGTSGLPFQDQIMANWLALELAEENGPVAQKLLSELIPNLQAHQVEHSPNDQKLESRLNLVATLLRHQQLEQLTRAMAFLESNLAQARLGQDEMAIAYALSHLGQAYEQRQQWDKAQQFSQSALQVAQAQQDKFQEYQFAWQLGRITRARWIESDQSQQDWMEQSEKAYQLALAALQQLRLDVATTVSPVLQFSFRQQVEPVYREYVDLLLSIPADEDSITKPAQLKQAIGSIEALRIAELENFLHDGCLETAPQAADQLDTNAAVIYPIVLKDRLEVIVSYQGKLRHHQADVSAQALTQTVQSFRDGLVTRSNRSYKQPGQQLYNWLMAPIIEELKADGITTLVVVPDAPLQTTPLGALWNGDQFLIEQFSVVTAPSLQLLPSQAPVSANPEAFVAGISQAHRGLAPLDNVEQELDAVQQHFPGKRLVNEAFTVDAFGQALLETQSPIVHIATHGQFSSDAAETFLLAWDDEIDIDEFQQLLERREQGTASPIELLVLSACETAVGDQAATLGLAGMAIRSGARSTLASLWSVEDEATAFLMEKFYEQLYLPSVDKAESVQQAQIAMLQDPIYQHPYYWSAFTLMGNWQ